MKKLTILISFLLILSITFKLGAQWQQTNGPNGGYIFSFTRCGSDVYCAANEGGVFKSTNSGLNWVESSNGLNHPAYIYHLASGGNNIYASGVGLFKSSDNGNNWISIIGDLPSNNVNGITISGSDIYVGVYSMGVYKSTNNGTNWLHVSNGLPNNPSITTLYSTNNTIFVGIYTNPTYGIYRSTNGGSNWYLLNGLPLNIEAFCITSNGNYIFAGLNGVYRSSNNGDNWQQVISGIGEVSGLSTNNDVIYASTLGVGVYVSSNNGTNWSQINNGLPAHLIVWTILYSNSYVIAGTVWTGIYTTTNNGLNWMATNSNVTSTKVYAISSTGSTLFAGTDGNAVFSTSDNGNNWLWLNSGFISSNPYIGAIYNFNNILFVGLKTTSGIYYSTNNGVNWVSSNSYVSAWAFNSISNYLFASGSSVIRSTNNGQSWTTIRNGLPSNFVIATSLTASANTLFCGIYEYGIYVSTNFGTSWIAASSGLTNYNISAMTTNNSFIFACTDTSGVFRSTNAGTSWHPANNGLTDLRTNTIYSYGNYLFVGTTSGGIYSSGDAGNSWMAINTGLNNKYVTSIYILQDYIYAGIYCQGIWRRLLSEVISVKRIGNYVPARYDLYQNYPNPFNPSTTIQIDIPRISLTKIIVYDILGREIETLVNNELKAGSYKVSFDGSNLSSGIYFYKLQASDFSQTKKMIFIK